MEKLITFVFHSAMVAAAHPYGVATLASLVIGGVIAAILYDIKNGGM